MGPDRWIMILTHIHVVNVKTDPDSLTTCPVRPCYWHLDIWLLKALGCCEPWVMFEYHCNSLTKLIHRWVTTEPR